MFILQNTASACEQSPLFSPGSITTPGWRTIPLEGQGSVNSVQTAPTASEELRSAGAPAAAPAGSLGQGFWSALLQDGFMQPLLLLSCSAWERCTEPTAHPSPHGALGTPDQGEISSHGVHCCTQSIFFNFPKKTPKTPEYCHSKTFLFCCNMIPVTHWDAEKKKENSGKIAITWIIFAIWKK